MNKPRVKCYEGHPQRVKAVYHYGNTRQERTISLAEFLQEMYGALAEMVSNAGRDAAVFSCIADLTATGRGEFGWNTYTLEGN